jgi:non-specific serine/threonine protein kinase/serine/threonine-protein kinase
MMHLVVDANPRRPSATPHSVDALPYSLARTLRGDLDAIVLHAIAKDPHERYGSAEELADDLKRFEMGAPVTAREPSFGYVLWKLALQHRVTFASATVAVVLIVAALVVTLWQARVAARERQRAEQRFAEVRQLANTLIFKIHDEVAPLAGSTSVRRTIVAEALGYLERLSAQSQGDPALQLELARAYNKIGRVQGLPGSANLGDRTGAIDSFRRSQALLAPSIAGSNPPGEVVTEFVDSTRRISETLRAVTGGDAEAVREAQRALEVAEIYYRRQAADVRARNQVASASFTTALAIGWAGPSLPYWNRAGMMYESLLADAPDNLDNVRNVALVEIYIGSVLYGHSELEHALEHHERALSLDERRLASNRENRLTQSDVAVDLGNVAHVRWKLGRPAEAVPLYEKSLALRKALAMTDPQDISAQSRAAFLHDKLAHVHTDLGQRAQALDHARAAVAIYESSAALAQSNPTGFGSLLLSRGHRARARGLDAEACASFTKSWGIFSVLDPAQARVPANRN